jgi:hypothetical protein
MLVVEPHVDPPFPMATLLRIAQTNLARGPAF